MTKLIINNIVELCKRDVSFHCNIAGIIVGKNETKKIYIS